MPPTRREQLELDELLSDIYRGIETLPDSNGRIQLAPGGSVYSRSYTREYELPASSPLVKQHKQELAALREVNATSPQQVIDNSATSKKPQRSTLKRNTTPQQQPQSQSLASFVTSNTHDNKRRVRIVDHPDKVGRDLSGSDDEGRPDQRGKPDKVKYVNTNKLIYHQERDPEDTHDSVWVKEKVDESDDEVENGKYRRGTTAEDDDDVDGATRVEYYHTTWLDRQLGRASKRRSSKELNERQVKEKAMIEELKRSLKNGAITLRQSFKGKRGTNKNKPSETYDDHMLDTPSSNRVKTKNSTVFGSGLATIPRNYNKNLNQNSNHDQKHQQSRATKQQGDPVSSSQSNHRNSDKKHIHTEPISSSNYSYNTLGTSRHQESGPHTSGYSAGGSMQQQQQATSYSRTLPHNYSQNTKTQNHQLLQSHYKNDRSFNKVSNHQTSSTSPRDTTSTCDAMRHVHYSSIQSQPYNNNNSAYNNNTQVKSPINDNHNHQQQQQQIGDTISSIPSGNEVVRSALSRSNSQISLNQLNKTINLLPNSPPPYANPSPMSPTQQLKAATPSLSPSPVCGTPYKLQQQHQYTNQNSTYNQQSQYHTSPNVASDFGSKTWGSSTPTSNRAQQYQQQPVYANPHASLMQHKMEQQKTQPSGRNAASIREFNELDSLLRSLSPATAQTTTHVTPGYTRQSTQPAFGFGPAPNATAGDNQPRPGADIYARVQKQPNQMTNHPAQQQKHQDQQQQQQQRHYASNIGANQDFTINVSDKKNENCLQRQELSEFEPPVELLPSMEDYQNISKLNPVKNHYWYKPNMSRDRAISLLKDKPQGTFIVRDSTSFRGAYGLAVKVSKLPKNVLNNVNLRNPNADPSSELIRHFLIEPTSNGVRLKGYANEPVFGSLPSLIYQHSLTELALPCKLVIPRADIEDPKFNQKQKQFYEDFLASKEQFKHSPYERTSPDGGYRKYPGNVYVHNEHRIIFE